MSKKYSEIMRKPKGSKTRMRLIIKNGVYYKIALESQKKPKYKKIKPFRNKRWIITNVRLLAFHILDQSEIDAIIKENSDEEKSYETCFAMETGRMYRLLLSNNQYTALRQFLTDINLTFKTPFYFFRIGTGFKTHLVYSEEATKKKGQK